MSRVKNSNIPNFLKLIDNFIKLISYRTLNFKFPWNIYYSNLALLIVLIIKFIFTLMGVCYWSIIFNKKKNYSNIKSRSYVVYWMICYENVIDLCLDISFFTDINCTCLTQFLTNIICLNVNFTTGFIFIITLMNNFHHWLWIVFPQIV